MPENLPPPNTSIKTIKQNNKIKYLFFINKNSKILNGECNEKNN